MALEDLTGSNKFISNLVPVNPADGDDIREGAAHLRGVKNVLINTFPSVNGAVTLTDEQFNALVNAVLAGADAALNSLRIGGTLEAPFIYESAPGVLTFRYGPDQAFTYAGFERDGSFRVNNAGINAGGTIAGVQLKAGVDDSGAEMSIAFATQQGIAGPYLYYSPDGVSTGMFWAAAGQVWGYQRATAVFSFGAPATVRARQFVATSAP